MIDIEKAKEEFLKYTANYDHHSEKIERKEKHSLRVVERSTMIANYLKLNEEDRLLAELIGLLHDIGRFEQVRRFNTFSDVKSGDWYADAVAWAQSNGIVAGHTDGTFRPDDKITNEQMAAIMKKYAEFKGKDTTVKGDEVWAINQLDRLRGCEAHASYIIEKGELNVIKNLGINLTCEPKM